MKNRGKLKTPAVNVPVPRDREEADEFIFKIGEATRDRAIAEADMNQALALIKGEYEAKAAPIGEQIAKLTKGLQTWADANRHELLKGNSKTVRLGNGEIAWRSRPSRVTVRGAAKVIAWLEEHKLDRFLRIKKRVNKEALRDDPEEAKNIPGISIGSAGEDFIVTPFEAALEEPAKESA